MNNVFFGHTLFLLFSIAGFFTNHVHAQKVIQIIDQKKQSPHPFTHLICDNEKQYITDHNGYAALITFPETLKVKTLSQGDTLIHFDDVMRLQQDTIVVSIHHKGAEPLIHYTSMEADSFIQCVIKHKNYNDPNQLSNFYYDTYNKFHIETNKLDETKSIADKFLSVFSLKLEEYPEDHHLLLSESVTQRRYHNKLNEDEVIVASRFSGIDRPFLLAVNSQIQSFSLYESFIRIANYKYVNPLTKKSYKKYHFQIEDTIHHQSGKKLVVVRFSPKKTTRFESLRGYYFIDSEHFGIERAWVYPSITRGAKMNLYQRNRLINETLWFPDEFFTQLELENIGSKQLDFFATTHTIVRNLSFNKNYAPNDFDEIAIRYDETAGNENNNFIIDTSRSVPLTPEDSNTYAFYDSVGTVNNFEKILYLGEKIYRKRIPFSTFNIHLNKVANFNLYEGIRVGIGDQTNEKLSKRWSAGGYIGYGLRDEQYKYGANLAYHTNSAWKWHVRAAHSRDVEESGASTFYLDRPQYTSEWIRRLRIRIMDIVHKNHLSLHFQPSRFLFGSLQLEQNINQVPYDYTFEGNTERTDYNYTTVGLHLKYAYGQRYFKLFNDQFPLDNNYPTFWLNVIKGLDGPLDGAFDFWKIEQKIEWSIPNPGLGITRFQLISGITLGDVPYFQLHRGLGSGQVLGVIHNSFETMGYNEFLSDRYTSLFATHDFGYINFMKAKNFRPKLEFAYNVGIGSLNNPDIHQEFDFETMENIFMEGGVMLNELLVFTPLYFKVAIGMGYYYRFGAYQLGTFGENSVIKLSTRFKL